jgi:hypothetical protein
MVFFAWFHCTFRGVDGYMFCFVMCIRYVTCLCYKTHLLKFGICECTHMCCSWLVCVGYNCSQSQSYIMTDSESASLSWCQAPIWDLRPIFLSLEIVFRQLWICYFVAPSLTRGWVCNLLLLLVLTSAVPLGSESLETQDHTLLFQFLRLPQPGGPGPRIYIPQEQGGPDIPPDTRFSFRHLFLQLTGLQWRYSILPPHGPTVLPD